MKYANIAPIVLGLIMCLGMVTHVIIANKSTSFQMRPIPPTHSDMDSYDYEKQLLKYEISQKHIELQKHQVAMQAGVIAVLMILLTMVIYILNLILVRLKSALVFNIISLVLSVGFIGWAFLMMANPRKIGFDEVGIAFIGFSIYIIVSGAIGISQAAKYKRRGKILFGNDEIIDDLPPSN